MVHRSHRRFLFVLGLCVALVLLLVLFASRTNASRAAADRVPAPCTTSQLRLEGAGGQGFTSHRELDFALRNMSPRTCTLRGYPGGAWLDRSARQLSRPVDRAPGRTVATVTLTPFRRAFFSFVYVVAGPCLPHQFIAYGLQFIPPGGTSGLRWYLGRTAVCAPAVGGNADVTPVASTHP